MKKSRVTLSAILLLMLMLLASLPLLATVKAYDYDYNYGYASNLYTTNWLQYNGEDQACATAFGQIENLFINIPAYYWDDVYQWWFYYGSAYGQLKNWGSTETPSDVYARVVSANNYHSTLSTVLYVGHGGPSGFYGHTDYPNDYGITPDLVSFAYIQSINGAAHKLAFMWVCNGGLNSPAGSPTAWNPLYWSNPPAYGPYTWIGFDYASPWLVDHMLTYGQNGQPNVFRYWLVFFYYYLLNGNSVMSALNQASYATGYANFGVSELANYGTYWTYFPWDPAQQYWYSGNMHVAGDPYGTYLPTTLYL
jgi:hypothetical protein